MRSWTRLVSFFAAYVCLLMGFAMLGLFVYALAADSPLTMMAGAGLVLFFVAAVMGFRAAARRRAESNESGIAVDGANMWAKPLRTAQIDRYLRTHRAPRAVEPAAETAGAIAPEYRRAA
jgi:thiol:disulfide interchange protein